MNYHLRHLFPASPVEFLPQTLCDGTSHLVLQKPKVWPNLKHHGKNLIFAHFGYACRCLLTKSGRSTLDTKEGSKTKTSSTSLVPPTQTPPFEKMTGSDKASFEHGGGGERGEGGVEGGWCNGGGGGWPPPLFA